MIISKFLNSADSEAASLFLRFKKISSVVLTFFIFSVASATALFFAGANAASAATFTVTENPTPVFSTLIPDQAYVIKDNVNYKLYYAGADFASIDLAQSPDGINWTPYSGNPVLAEGSSVQAEHADVHFYSSGFTGANLGTNPTSTTMYYRMWYQGAVSGIGGWRYTESPDGINWYNQMAVVQHGTPVFSSATGVDYGIADVVYTPGGEGGDVNKTFRIYANVQWEIGSYGAKELIVMAYSANGYDWTGYDPTSVGYATPVFAGTLDGVSFDTDHIGWFKVIKNSDTNWEAFYSGGKDTTYQALDGIGYATSNDGINWVRKQTLFTTNDSAAWRNQSVWMPSVVKSGNNYKIFFLGSNNPMTDGSWIWWQLGEADLVKTAPTIAATDPADASNNISPGRNVNATFSVAMDPATITATTFTLKKGATSVAGVVSYSGLKATFTPNVILDSNSVYTATVTTGATDADGNALAANHAWNFTTGGNYEAWVDHGVGYAAPASGNAYYPSVIYDANAFGAGTSTYAMWYSDGDGSVFLITSANGVSWGAPTTMAGLTNASHVQVLYDANCFGTVPCNASTTKYKIWFWNMGAPTIYSLTSMATAESADGINWINQQAVTQNSAAQLVIDPYVGAGWNSGTYGPVNLFYQPSVTNTGTDPWNYKYVMYYDGTDGNQEYTGLAYSTDGLYWNAYTGNPVLSGSLSGGSEVWDCVSAVYGTVFKDSAGYHFFYSGNGQGDGAGGCTATPSFDGIGYAASVDGKTWIKDSASIFRINDGVPYRSGRVYTPSVIDDGSGILRMYFSVKDSVGGPKKIGYATLVKPVAPAPAPSPVAQPASTGNGSGGLSLVSGVTISGNAFTGANIKITAYAGSSAIRSQSTIASADGSFSLGFFNVPPESQFYAIVATDKDGITNQAKIYFESDSGANNQILVNGIILSPTIGFASQLVRKGDYLVLTGYASPGFGLEAQIDGNITKLDANTNSEGFYRILVSTAGMSLGTHNVRIRQINKSNVNSDFSPQKTFTITSLFVPKVDFNGDGRVDIQDWSIFLSQWTSDSPKLRALDDLNGDGKLDVSDFSIFIRVLKTGQ